MLRVLNLLPRQFNAMLVLNLFHLLSDMYLDLTDDHADDNLIFEVKQLGDASDPTAFTVFLYEQHIPENRQSERRSERASKGTYSVAMSR